MEKFWKPLITHIRLRQVVPIVGPELVTITHPATGAVVPITEWLADEVAAEFGLPDRPGGEPYRNFNDVAKGLLVSDSRADTRDLHDSVRSLLCAAELEPGEHLRKLAGIADFETFLTTTYDDLLERALRGERNGMVDPVTFHPKKPDDLPDSRSTRLYYILANQDTYPDFGLWDEDHIRFLCALQERHAQLPRLLDTLMNKHLLLIGTAFNDWVSRFFLHVAKQSEFSNRDLGRIYVLGVDGAEQGSLVFFLDKVTRYSTIIQSEPHAFVEELHRRWSENRQDHRENARILERARPASGAAVFISYAREDREAANRVVDCLQSEHVPVWVDTQRLTTGDNFDNVLEDTVMDQERTKVFVSLISQTTEGQDESYFHLERRWAAARQERRAADAPPFYIPIVIDEAGIPPTREPRVFRSIHCDRCPGGELPSHLVEKIRNLMRYRG